MPSSNLLEARTAILEADPSPLSAFSPTALARLAGSDNAVLAFPRLVMSSSLTDAQIGFPLTLKGAAVATSCAVELQLHVGGIGRIAKLRVVSMVRTWNGVSFISRFGTSGETSTDIAYGKNAILSEAIHGLLNPGAPEMNTAFPIEFIGGQAEVIGGAQGQGYPSHFITGQVLLSPIIGVPAGGVLPWEIWDNPNAPGSVADPDDIPEGKIGFIIATSPTVEYSMSWANAVATLSFNPDDGILGVPVDLSMVAGAHVAAVVYSLPPSEPAEPGAGAALVPVVPFEPIETDWAPEVPLREIF